MLEPKELVIGAEQFLQVIHPLGFRYLRSEEI